MFSFDRSLCVDDRKSGENEEQEESADPDGCEEGTASVFEDGPWLSCYASRGDLGHRVAAATGLYVRRETNAFHRGTSMSCVRLQDRFCRFFHD